MQTLELSEQWLAIIKNILLQYAPNAEIWAYGSRISHQSHDGSDLDLVIRNPKNINSPNQQLAKIKQAFRESDLPILIDIMDWAKLPENYKHNIQQQHVVIHLK